MQHIGQDIEETFNKVKERKDPNRIRVSSPRAG